MKKLQTEVANLQTAQQQESGSISTLTDEVNKLSGKVAKLEAKP